MTSRTRKCIRYDVDDDYDARGYESNSESSASEEEEFGGSPTVRRIKSIRPPDHSRHRNHRNRPTLGVPASLRRYKQQRDNYSSTTYSSTNLSSPMSTTNDTTETDPSELYTPIDRSKRVSRHKTPGLPMFREISPVRDDEIFTRPLSPQLHSYGKNFRPQHTSTTTSIHAMPQMTGMPRMGSSNLTGSNNGIITSTPRSSAKSRLPPLTSYNQVLSMPQNAPKQRPHSYYGSGTVIDYRKQTDSFWDNMRPASSRSVSGSTASHMPMNYGLNPCWAKNYGCNGVASLTITLTGRQMISIGVEDATYFFNSPLCNSFISLEKRRKLPSKHGEDRHSSRKRHTSSRNRDHPRSLRTDLIQNCNRPEFRTRFDFKLDRESRKESIFLAAWSTEDTETGIRKSMIGCMTFDIRRLLKKAQDAGARSLDENMMEEIVIGRDRYFFLSPSYGEFKNMPQSKVKASEYYDLDGCTMTNSSNSSGDITGSSKMPMEEFVTASRNFGQSLVPMQAGYGTQRHMDDNLTFSTASSSTNSGVASHPYSYHLHRNTLPSITTTSYSSSNNEGLSGISSVGPNGATDFQHLYVDPSQSDGKIPKNHVFMRPSPSKESSVRRAASFTYSPKGSADKLNKRQVKEEPQKEFLKKMSFSNPIQKTISFLRNKMDGSNSSIAHPSKEEVNKWKSSFDALVQNKYGNQLFRQFLNKEMSSENLDFWEHCEEFRNKWKDDKKSMTKKANEIYQKFITEQAPNQVNLDCATREATKAALYSGCEKDTFSLAQNIIEKLMETDSYKRFLKDPIYLDVLRSFDVENTNPQKH